MLQQQYRAATSINHKIEILEALEDHSLSTTFTHSQFALEQWEELSMLPSLTYPQQLRLSWMFSLVDIDIEPTIDKLLASFHEESTEERVFVLETLFQIDMFATESQRNQILHLYNSLTTKAKEDQNLHLQSRLIILSTKYLLPRLASLSEKLADLAS